MLPTLLLTLCLVLPAMSDTPSHTARLAPDPTGHHLVDRVTGEPFLWLGDTAWSAIKMLTRDQMDAYLDHRRDQGFTVIQTILIGHDPGPNIHGQLPFQENWDVTRPATIASERDYWDEVDYFVDGILARGMTPCLLPLWRKHVFEEPLVGKDETYEYGQWLGRRFRGRNDRIVWCLGGDMYVDFKNGHDASYDLWHNLARGLTVGTLGEESYERMAMTYHIWGGHTTADIDQLRAAPWMTFHALQSGHEADRQEGMLVRSRSQASGKPVIDLEPMYDDHFGENVDRTRHINWWGVFEGGFGTTMGSWNVWHFGERGWEDDRTRWEPPRSYETGFATQIRHLGALLESRPAQLRRFAPEVLHSDSRRTGPDRVYANRYADGSCILVYTPRGEAFDVDLSYLAGDRAHVWWYNPRDGSHQSGGTISNKGSHVSFDPPGDAGPVFSTHDWVLILDDASASYPPPGQPAQTAHPD